MSWFANTFSPDKTAVNSVESWNFLDKNPDDPRFAERSYKSWERSFKADANKMVVTSIVFSVIFFIVALAIYFMAKNEEKRMPAYGFAGVFLTASVLLLVGAGISKVMATTRAKREWNARAMIHRELVTKALKYSEGEVLSGSASNHAKSIQDEIKNMNTTVDAVILDDAKMGKMWYEHESTMEGLVGELIDKQRVLETLTDSMEKLGKPFPDPPPRQYQPQRQQSSSRAMFNIKL